MSTDQGLPPPGQGFSLKLLHPSVRAFSDSTQDPDDRIDVRASSQVTP